MWKLHLRILKNLTMKRLRGDEMRLFTQTSENQFHYVGDYDISPSGNLIDGRSGNPMSESPMRGNAQRLMNRYKKTTTGMAIGLIVGILLITIGFFKTLLLAILIGVGFVVGGFFDRHPIVMKFLKNLG